jgi:hypothetical protein
MSAEPSAADFRAVFKRCYEESRSRQNHHWKKIWNDSYAWSQLMIYDDHAVVRRVAPHLNLRCYQGEPLRLDAAFHEQDAEHWFPMRVAIEHENSPFTFYKETRAILSVRCPLKVGITYTLQSDIRRNDLFSELSDLRNRVADAIHTNYKEISKVVKEDIDTEYLFLIGSEEEPYEIRWYSVDFRAADPPKERPVFIQIG